MEHKLKKTSGKYRKKSKPSNSSSSYLMDPLVSSPLLSPVSANARMISSSPFSIDSNFSTYEGGSQIKKIVFFEGCPNPLHSFFRWAKGEKYTISTNDVIINPKSGFFGGKKRKSSLDPNITDSSSPSNQASVDHNNSQFDLSIPNNGTIVLDIMRIKDVSFKPYYGDNNFWRKLLLKGLFGCCLGLNCFDDCVYGSHYRGMNLDDYGYGNYQDMIRNESIIPGDNLTSSSSSSPHSSGTPKVSTTKTAPTKHKRRKNPHKSSTIHENNAEGNFSKAKPTTTTKKEKKIPITFGKITIFYENPESLETSQYFLFGVSYDIYLKLALALQEARFSFEEAEIEAKKKRLIALERQNPEKDFSFHVDFDMEELIINEDTIGRYDQILVTSEKIEEKNEFPILTSEVLDLDEKMKGNVTETIESIKIESFESFEAVNDKALGISSELSEDPQI